MSLPANIQTIAELEEILITCRRCPRLVTWREEVARTRRRAYRDWTYWGKPVPGFGDAQARLLVVGLAPGAHGSNRTGRMFTGDASGEFLYAALHRMGFASQPTATRRDDGLTLKDIFITAVAAAASADKNRCRMNLRHAGLTAGRDAAAFQYHGASLPGQHRF